MILRRLFLAALLLFGIGRTASAQISPGPLARAHATLEGPTNCVQCHGIGKKERMTDRCLACHKEVQWLGDRQRGLHPRERTGAKQECASCHPDHAGVDFALVDWGKGGKTGFNHDRAGWTLEGKHLKAKCEACHQEKYRTSPAAALTPRKGGAGWTGLESSCASCHRSDDVHRNALGARCESCHDANDWKKAAKFDHDRSEYRLTGKHADVACDKCHKAAKLNLQPEADGHVVGKFKPIRHAECSDCHADPHKGRLGVKCSTCHETKDFNAINRSEFNHAVTRYPLQGKHQAAKCEACHAAGLAKKTPAFAACTDCHADSHLGGAMSAGKLIDCASCHRVEGFSPSTFTVARHASLAFPLGGKHASAKCASCHPVRDGATAGARVARVVPLHPTSTACSDCHVDAHPGDLTRSTTTGTCTACHSEAGWRPSTFGVAQHAALALPLDGAHAAVPCVSCHPSSPPAPVVPATMKTGRATQVPPVTSMRVDSRRVALRPSGGACDACHVDPHAGRYNVGGAAPQSTGCVACHDARRFVPARLDAARHATLGFSLEGAHRAVICRDCHKELGRPAGAHTLRTATTGRPAPLTFGATRRSACSACHEDPHGGQFAARKNGGACETCHEPAQWNGAAKFNHERDTPFPLAGAHSRVPCAACHVAATQSGGAGPRVRYRPLPVACEGCHKSGVPKR